MRADRPVRHRRAHGVVVALLTAGTLTAALLATAVLATTASAPAALTRITVTQVTATGTGAAPTQAPQSEAARPSGAATPGWRVVKKIGPATGGIAGLLTAVSATDAWSAWSGPGVARVEHWTDGAWVRVPVPASLDAFVKSAVSIGASSAGDVWLFGAHPATRALRWTGREWQVEAIPSWVVRSAANGVSATAAVFGPADVWVFSLGKGAYAAHWNGRSWTRVTLPAVPYDVSFAGPDDIWALGNGHAVLRWNGAKWSKVRLAPPPLPKRASLSYSALTVIGPKNAWLFRSIFPPGHKLPVTALLHWTGSAWHKAASPADLVGSLAPDGHGGLWANAVDLNPGGFWLLYHYADGRWTETDPPSAVFDHTAEELTSIPGTHSLWSVGTGIDLGNQADEDGLILKYGA